MKATVLALSLLCAGTACAQSPTPAVASARQAQHMDDLATLLDLTAAQKAQVQTILQAQRAKMQTAFEQAKASGSKPDWTQMKALHQQVEQETLQQLTPVLSALQLKKFQILQKSMHGRFHHHGGPPAAASAPAAQG
jgi:hypothetical protein